MQAFKDKPHIRLRQELRWYLREGDLGPCIRLPSLSADARGLDNRPCARIGFSLWFLHPDSKCKESEKWSLFIPWYSMASLPIFASLNPKTDARFGLKPIAYEEDRTMQQKRTGTGCRFENCRERATRQAQDDAVLAWKAGGRSPRGGQATPRGDMADHL